MYVLRIMVELENDTLVNPVNTAEIKRILGEVTRDLESRELQHGEVFRGTVRDTNGNKVCSYNLENTR